MSGDSARSCTLLARRKTRLYFKRKKLWSDFASVEVKSHIFVMHEGE